MSGFVALVDVDGGRVDTRLLQRMTTFMAFRGPDGQATWQDGPAGLGQTWLRTTDDEMAGCQPLTLDGRLWVVGDIRLDASSDLRAQLVAAGEPATANAPDAELLLRAYRVWGEGCVEHLIGDFAFALWDVTQTCLFCARDQLGVKALFYTRVGRTVIVSNTIDCLRQHPGVSGALNDQAIADFLLFELNHDPATTVYADIGRVPPAHAAVWTPAGMTVKRYWSLPIDEPVFYRRAGDYVDRFNEVMDQAVADRLRTERVGIFMSGGIDSPALAAVASRVYRRQGRANGVRAYTTVVPGHDRNEGHFAGLVANHLSIPIEVEQGGAAAFDPEWAGQAIHTPAPIRDVGTLASDRHSYREMSRYSRVALYGEGPDNALQYEWQAYVGYLTGRRRYGRLAGDVVRHVTSHRRLPLASIVRRLIRARRSRGQWDVPYPAWLNPDLERRLGLRDRWEQLQWPQAPPVAHPVRPAAFASFCGPEWEALFRGFDAEETGAPLDVRHPYVDLRVLRYLLSVPAVPWCRSKHLIRRAMRPYLPGDVLRRPKSGMTGDPDYGIVSRVGLPTLVPDARLAAYVELSRVPEAPGSSMIEFRADFRPRALNFWLSNLQAASPHVGEESEHDVAHA